LLTIPPISTTRAITSKTVMVINSTNINNKAITVLEVIVRFVDCCGIDDKGLIRIRKSKKDRQHNDPKKKDRRTNYDLVTRTPLKHGDEGRCSGRVGKFCSTSGTCRVNLAKNPVITHQ
jgi:hypothetical protein